MRFRVHIYVLAVFFIVWSLEISAKLNTKDYMICGGVSTAITDLLLFPLDTIKVTQQSSKQIISGTQAFQQILKSGGGFAALYKGALGYAAIDGLGSALFFAVFERVKRFSVETLHLSGPLLGASVYGTAAAAFGVSSVILVPAELIKARMQTQAFSTIGHCLKDAISKERGGLLGLYTGYTATMIRDLPYFALQLGFYDNIKSALERQFGRPVDNATHASTPSKLLTGSPSSRGLDRIRERVAQLHLDQVRLSPAVIDLISGTTAGFLTGLLTNPMDVVTARLMTQKADLAKELLPAFRASVGAPYRGLGDCAMRMLREEGLSSFLIGVKSRVGWIAPFTAISLGLNNVLRRRAERAHAARALPLAL